MILRLRQRHRRIFAVLGVLLPIAFIIGVAARQPIPRAASLSRELSVSSKIFEATVWQRDDLFTKSPVHVRLQREKSGNGSFAVSLFAEPIFVKPDLLVYWIPHGHSINGTLPDEAILLGTFAASTLLLPNEILTTTGSLVLFSLADQEIVEVSKSFTL